jgi:hypothetical protein
MYAAMGISNSSGLDYAMDLARNSSLKRSLYHLSTAIENGDLPFARSVLTALIKANPEYSTSTPGEGSQPPDQTDQDFKALTDAISDNDIAKVRSAWTVVKADLARNGIASLSDGTAATAKLLAESKASVSLQILSATFGKSSTDVPSGMLVFGERAHSESSKESGLGSSLLNAWFTYKAGGNPSPRSLPDGTENNLDATA